MTEAHVHVFLLAKLFFILTELCARQAYLRGFCPPWLLRNLARFTTLLFGASLVVESNYKWGNGMCFVVGLILWNRPKDGDGPKRRRRKEEKKEEQLPPNWSGIPEAA